MKNLISPSPVDPAAELKPFESAVSVPSGDGVPHLKGLELLELPAAVLSSSIEDLTGQSFGRLTVIKPVRTPIKFTNLLCWVCRCSCGNIIAVKRTGLVRHNTSSCGCYKLECISNRRKLNLAGQTFNRLTALRRLPEKKYRGYLWECLCACGNITTANVNELKSGHKKSCGCLLSQVSQAWMKNLHKSGRTTGKNHHHWNSNLTEQDRLSPFEQRFSERYRDTRKKVYTRDKFTCRVCHNHKGPLQAHHIKAWSRFPEDRYRLLNVITLCKNCHKEFHKTYGRNRQTAHQFFEWWRTKKETQQNARDNFPIPLATAQCGQVDPNSTNQSVRNR